MQVKRAASYSRTTLAILGFLGHAPLLKSIVKTRFSPRFVSINLLAVALTLIAMALAYAKYSSGLAILVAWLVGHFAWSTILAIWAYVGGVFAQE